MSVNNTTTSLDPGNEKKCTVCKISSRLLCSSCKIIYYCGPPHQISDWNSHSKNCPLFKLVDDPNLGRHYEATRIIRPGDVIFHDKKPLLAIPPKDVTPCCLNCYVPLKLNNANDCVHCGWPLCLECKRHGAECELTMKYRKAKVKIDNYTEINPIYEAILVMRAIAMRDYDQEDYQKMMNLKDHYDRQTRETNFSVASPREVAVLVKNYMRIDDLTVEEIAKIIGIMRINGFEAQTSSENFYSLIYENASFLSHSCHANCDIVIMNDVPNKGNIVVRAIRNIPQGNPITISYTNPSCGTNRRRAVLRKIKFFDCACERCSDPTEFGTMFNAIKCINGKCNGYMLPPTFLVRAEEIVPDYVCNKCKAVRSSEEIDNMLDVISAKFSNIAVNDVDELKKFIHENSKILHKNHFHIFNAEYKLAMRIGPEDFDAVHATNESLRENINLCEKLDVLLKKLMTGRIEWRSKLLVHKSFNITTLAANLRISNPFESQRLIKEAADVRVELEEISLLEVKCRNELQL